MDRVAVYLRTPLYTPGGAEAHLPSGVMIVEASLVEWNPAGVRLDVDRLLDERGHVLREDDVVTLIVPWAKVDHVLVIA